MNLNFSSTRDIDPEKVAQYFDQLDFTYQPNWKGCYCRFYHNDLPFDQWMKRTADDNRNEMIKSFKNQSMHGLLALEDDRIIAWLNINDVENYARIYPYVPEVLKKQKIACSICFIVHPDDRGQGIATQLLEFAIQYYTDLNYDALIALPVSGKGVTSYRGPESMYIKAGYQILEANDDFKVLILYLKTNRNP